MLSSADALIGCPPRRLTSFVGGLQLIGLQVIGVSQRAAMDGVPPQLMGIKMRSIIVCAAAMSLAVSGDASAQAASGPDIPYYMVVIASSTSGTSAGVQMSTLTFPSERSCVAAAAVFGQSTASVNVVARCAPRK